MDFECLAHHFGAHACLQILVVLYKFLLGLQLVLMTFDEFALAYLCLALFEVGIRFQLLYLRILALDDFLSLALLVQEGNLEIGLMLFDSGIQSSYLLFLGSEGKVLFAFLLCSDGFQPASQLGYFSFFLADANCCSAL